MPPADTTPTVPTQGTNDQPVPSATAGQVIQPDGSAEHTALPASAPVTDTAPVVPAAEPSAPPDLTSVTEPASTDVTPPSDAEIEKAQTDLNALLSTSSADSAPALGTPAVATPDAATAPLVPEVPASVEAPASVDTPAPNVDEKALDVAKDILSGAAPVPLVESPAAEIPATPPAVV